MQNKKDAVDHIKNHQKYPAAKADVMAECDDLSDFSEDDKKWFKEHLTKDSYESADELLTDLGLTEE